MNSKDRILINGVWYVRETEPETETKEIETTDLICSVYETEDYVWKASKIYKDDGETLYDGIDVEFTDKTTTPSCFKIFLMSFINGETFILAA